MHVGRTGWDDRGDESAFASVGGHAAPGDAVVVAGGGAVPVGVEAVIGGAVADRLVLSDGLGVNRKGFEIGGGPILVALHGLVGLLVKRCGDVKVRSLDNSVVPGGWSPLF